MMPNRPGRVSLILLLVLAGAAYGAGAATLYFFPWKSAHGVDEGEPPPRSANDPVVGLGRLRPAGGYLTISGPPGDQIDALHATLGATFTVPEDAALKDRVPLVTLASHAERGAELSLLETQHQAALQEREVALANADSQIELELQRLTDLKANTPREIEALQAKIPPLEQHLRNSQARLERLRELRAKNSTTVSQQEIDDLTLVEKTAAAELKSAVATVDKTVAAGEQGLRAADLHLKTAREAKTRAEKDAAIKTLESKIDLARLLRDRSILRAPPGSWRVVKVWGQRGEPTAPQQPILQLAATGSIIAIAEVYETDVGRLREWKRAGSVTATIKSRALPQPLEGSVTVIPDVITRNTITDIDPAADVDRRVFEVQVGLDGKSSELAAGYLNLQVQVELKPGSTSAARP
jgi:HlyD family secretion protein